MDDPKSFRSILARNFPKELNLFDENNEKNFHNKIKQKSEFISSFSADPSVLAFVRYFCQEEQGNEKNYSIITSFYTSVLYECLTQEKTEFIPIYIFLYNTIRNLFEQLNSQSLWSIKLIIQFYKNRDIFSIYDKNIIEIPPPLISLSFIECLRIQIEKFFSKFQFHTYLEKYYEQLIYPDFFIITKNISKSNRLLSIFGCFLIYYDIYLFPLDKSLFINPTIHSNLLPLYIGIQISKEKNNLSSNFCKMLLTFLSK